MIDFTNIDYLKNGNSKQQAVYAVLTEQKILEKLSSFSPIVVGTIPINVDIDSSDIDIACCWEDKQVFIHTLDQAFGQEKNFSVREKILAGNETVIAVFSINGFETEIFGQPIRSDKQHGYRHMLIEYELLCKKGEDFRKQIIDLKRKGLKTEPAFARSLGLNGDPYSELLKFEKATDHSIDDREVSALR